MLGTMASADFSVPERLLFFFSEPRVQKERHLRSPRVRHDTFTLMPAAFTPARSRQVLGFGMSSYLTPCNRLICDFCSSGQRFAAGFLQIPPHDGHPCLWLTLPPDGRVRDLHPRVSRHAGRTSRYSSGSPNEWACSSGGWHHPYQHQRITRSVKFVLIAKGF